MSTAFTLGLAVLRYPTERVRRAAVLSVLCVLAMVLHVLSWFVLGVVMAPTYILLILAGICLSLNLWVVAHPVSLQRGIARLGKLRST
ncbi:hypothetical protein [Gloeobacter violaceus]|uniref:hypothetical protein n=1 Tax=Gloeobacter violaceus TaxID=33072 RepID=UPI0018D2A655|nr:hypothetical protein [Gloeobacter violaceus]